MPVHRVRVDDVEAELERIEASERVTSVVAAGDGAVLVFTETKTAKRAQPGDRESR